MNLLIKGMSFERFLGNSQIHNESSGVSEIDIHMVLSLEEREKVEFVEIPEHQGRLISSSSLLGRFTEIMRRNGKKIFSYEAIAEIIMSEKTIIDTEE